MPDYLSLYAIEPSFEGLTPAQQTALGERSWPDLDDDLQTFDTLHAMLLALAQADRSLELKLLARAGVDWLGLLAFVVHHGAVRVESFELALQPDAPAPLKLAAAPDVPLELDEDADAFLDELGAVFDELSEVAADGHTLTLGLRVEDRAGLAHALSAVAPHLVGGPVSMFVESEAGFERLTLGREVGAKLEPLHVWHADPGLRAFAQRHVRAGGEAPVTVAAGASTTQPTSRRDARNPLTTGSASARHDAVYELGQGEGALAEVRAALASPENAGPRFAPLRAALYDQLVRRAGLAALPEVLQALERDRELAAELYGQLSKLDDPRAHEALVRGFKTETGATRGLIRQVIWRQEGAVERLVRQELVPSFGRDAAWSATIIRLLEDEWIRVPRAWLGESPPAGLVEKLGRLVV